MGEALIAAAAEAGIRITLLDTAYLLGGFGAAPATRCPAALLRRHRRGAGPSGSALKGARHARIGAAIHSVRAVPAGRLGHRRRTLGRRRPLHVHLSEQTAENDACRGPRPHPHPAARRPRRAGPAHHRRARHPPHRRGHRAARRHRHRRLHVPHHRARPRRRHRPGRRSSRRGLAALLGSDSHAVIDLLEEARAMELNERLRTRTRGHWTAARCCAPPPTTATPPSAGPTRAAWSPARSPTSRRSRWTPSAPRAPLPRARRRDGRIRGDRRGRPPHGGRRPAHRPRRGPPARPRRPAALTSAIAVPARLTRPRCPRPPTTARPPAGASLLDHRHRQPAHERPLPRLGRRRDAETPSDSIPDAAVVIDGGRVAWVGRLRQSTRHRQPPRRGRPGRAARLRRLALATWSSPATAAAEFAARMAGRALHRGRHPHHRRRDPRRHRRRARANLGGSLAESSARAPPRSRPSPATG